MSNSDIIGVCNTHGNLYIDDVYINKRKFEREGKFNFQCKACMKRFNKSYMEKAVAGLSDGYVKRILRQGDKTLKGVEIPQELIELKRATMKIKRLTQDKDQKELEAWLREQFITNNTKL